MEPEIRFRPLKPRDFPAVLRWFNEPHAVRWYGGGCTLEDVEDDYVPILEGRHPAAAHVVEIDGADAGLFEWCRLGDFPVVQAHYGVDDPDTVNIDVILSAAAAGRGVGPRAIRSYLREVVFAAARATTCVIDPLCDNSVAIRAYEKAGFVFTRSTPEDGEGNSVYLMTLRADELDRERAAPAFVIRPARASEVAVAVAIDDDAGGLYAEAGLDLSALGPTHPFVLAERARFAAAAAAGRLLFAGPPGAPPAAFIALTELSSAPFIDQVSVRRAASRRGLGTALVERALRVSVRAGECWLTTYAHLPWNAPYYERLGFSVVPEPDCPEEVAGRLASERAALPEPRLRVAMRCRVPR